MKRNKIIDLWRGLAVLLVTGFHIYLWSYAKPGEGFYGFNLSAILGNGWVGVGLFFVLSGFCLAGTTERTFSGGVNLLNSTNYFIKRFLRIALPYYISIIFWVFSIVVLKVAVKPTGLVDILTHVFFVHNLSEKTFFTISGVYWSLAVEMQLYLLLPFAVAFCTSGIKQVTVFFAAILVAVLINVNLKSIVFTWGVGSFFSLFFLGYVCSVHKKALYSVLGGNKSFLLLLSLVVLILLYKGVKYDNKVILYEILICSIAAPLVAVSVVKFNESDNFFITVMSYIGKCSYSIYLYNYVFWFFPKHNNNYLYLIFVYAFIIVFGCAMNHLVERKTEAFRKRIITRYFAQA